MTLILQAATVLGWRGWLGLAVGVTLASAPAYQAGRWIADAEARERTDRILAQQRARQMESENELMSQAMSARRQADRDGGLVPDGGRLHDDGYRRD